LLTVHQPSAWLLLLLLLLLLLQ